MAIKVASFDKALLSTVGSVGGVVFACQGIFYIEKQGLSMRLGKGGGAAAAILKNQITFCRVTRQEDIF